MNFPHNLTKSGVDDSFERKSQSSLKRMPPLARMVMPEQTLERSALRRAQLQLAPAKAPTGSAPRIR